MAKYTYINVLYLINIQYSIKEMYFVHIISILCIIVLLNPMFFTLYTGKRTLKYSQTSL